MYPSPAMTETCAILFICNKLGLLACHWKIVPEVIGPQDQNFGGKLILPQPFCGKMSYTETFWPLYQGFVIYGYSLSRRTKLS